MRLASSIHLGLKAICAPLLTRDEVGVLKQHRGNLQLLLQTWALRALRHGCIECMPPAESQLTYLEMERKVRVITPKP